MGAPSLLQLLLQHVLAVEERVVREGDFADEEV